MKAKISVTLDFDDYFQFKTTMDFFERSKKTIEKTIKDKGDRNFTSVDRALYNFVNAFLTMSKV